MRKLFLSILAGTIFLVSHEAMAFDQSFRIPVDETINKRSIVVTNPRDDERYLLYLSSGCNVLKPGQMVNLTIRGALNSAGDSLREDSLYRCRIERADLFNERFYVDFVFAGNTEAQVTDESGEKHFMKYSDGCTSMPRYRDDHIYILKGGQNLAQGDRVYLPNKDGNCWVTFIREDIQSNRRAETSSDKDLRAPNTVARVRALPGNGEVFLNWREGSDDQGISHYVVSYSRSKINTRSIDFDAMPNRTRADRTFITVDNLENNKVYYFYVAAVDTSGNVSANWSDQASAIPRSSVLSTERQTGERTTLNLKIDTESSRSFLIKWTRPTEIQRQTVILEADGRRVFARNDYWRSNIRILKQDSRKDKELTLKVRGYDRFGLRVEEEIEFEF